MAESGNSQVYIYLLMLGMVLTGAANTLIFKAQGKQVDEEGQPYNHPFVQAFSMFLGESLCLIMLVIRPLLIKNWSEIEEKQKEEAQRKNLNTDISVFWLAIPAGTDTITSCLQLAGLFYVDASIYQMLRGGVIIITAFMSVFIMKRKLYSHHYLGIFLCAVGITTVGAAKLNAELDTKAILGMGLLGISLFTNGLLFISEEKIFSKYYIEPLKMVGLEGVWGMIFTGAVLIPLASVIPCNKNPDNCPWGYIEDPMNALHQIGHNNTLLYTIIGGCVILALFNFCGVSVTKNVSSLARSILDVTRVVLVWGIQLAMGEEKFLVLQLIGFIVLVIGNLIYNEILEVPGLTDNLKRNLDKQSLLSASEDEEH